MLDYLELEGDLTGEEKLVRDEARRFVDEQVKPDIGEHYKAGTFPIDLIPKMGDLGFYALNLDGHGFLGLGEHAYGLLMQELEAGDSGLRLMASVQGSPVIYPIHAYGFDEQKQRWLPKLGSSEAVGCFGPTEPQHGSDPSGMETRAERDADGYVLNGSKAWITNSPIVDVTVVWACDVSAEGSPIRGFLVKTDRDGATTNKIEGKLLMRASVTGEIGLDDARVPEEDVLPSVEGMNGPLSCLTQARFGIAWGVVGAARDAFKDARQYAKDRDQFGDPIVRFQPQRGKPAEMATQITNAQLMAHHFTDLKERDDLRHQQVSMAKRHNVRITREVTRTAREMLGGNGITTGYLSMRHMENIETIYTYEGADDIRTLVLGADLTGIEAFHWGSEADAPVAFAVVRVS